jgi:ariadne-1
VDPSSGVAAMECDSPNDGKEVTPSAVQPARRASVGIGKRHGNDEYSVLTLEDLEADQDELVSQVAELASLGKDRASILLLKFNWNKEKLLEAYFQNAEKTCADAGAMQRTVDTLSSSSNNRGVESEGKTDEPMFMCNIIFERVPISQTFSMGCTTEDHPEDHRFSLEAWKDYLSCKTDDGPECVFARCPMDGCQCGVSPNVWEAILSHRDPNCRGEAKGEEEEKYAHALQLYRRFMSESYVNINRNIKWCPSAGCSAAFKASGAVTHVTCTQCGVQFCFKCGLEPHGPMRCALLSVWMDKCSNESETANWILANTKKCPVCQTRIEKNSGCNHMTCGMCKHDFCWVCDGPWANHGTSTGGYYSCNKYTEEGADTEGEGGASTTADGKTKAKRELDRYLFYYQRFATHEQAGEMKFSFLYLSPIPQWVSRYFLMHLHVSKKAMFLNHDSAD